MLQSERTEAKEQRKKELESQGSGRRGGAKKSRINLSLNKPLTQRKKETTHRFRTNSVKEKS